MDSTDHVRDPPSEIDHSASPPSTSVFFCTIPQLSKQIPMGLKWSDLFDPNFDVENILTDVNLFDKEKCRFSGKDEFYEAIEPALRLASRIILSYQIQYSPFITRSENFDCVYKKDVPVASTDTLLNFIRPVIPFIDMDEGMYERRDEWAMTSLEPIEDRDVVLLYFKLLRNYKAKWVTIFQKYISWAILALLLCHEMAQILEF